MTFYVANAAWGRLKNALLEKRKGFFIWATIDGRTLALNLDYVHLVRFTSTDEQIEVPISVGRHNKISLYYLGNSTQTFRVKNAEELANIFSSLKLNPSAALSFTELEGEQVVFLPEDLILVDVSTIFVEDGYLQIYKQKKSKSS